MGEEVREDKRPGASGFLIGALLIAVFIGVFMFLKPPSDAGNRAKLDHPLTAVQQQAADSRTVSAAELAAADGLEGRPGWVAVNGIVYDVSDSPGWKDGQHKGAHAGRDETDLFVQSAHALETMSRRPVVGRLG